MDSDSADERNIIMMDKEESGAKVYVKGFAESVAKEDFEEIFGRFGKIRSVWIASNPATYAFVEFYDQRDAGKAVDELNGKNILGGKLLVEMSRRESRSYRSRGGRGTYFRGRGSRFSGYRGGRGTVNFNRNFNSGSSNWRGGRSTRSRGFGSRGFTEGRNMNDEYRRNPMDARGGRERDYDRGYERGRQYEKHPHYNRYDRPEFFDVTSGVNHSDDSGFHSNSRYRSRSPASRFRKYSNSYNSRDTNFTSNRGSGRNYYNYEKPTSDRPRSYGTSKDFHPRNNSSFERRMSSSSRMRY